MKNVPARYRLEIEGLVRELPVVEVAPGVRIAVLKLATDAELTEAIGVALARRMPPEVDVLVMPDGKAQSLLHVIQRVTGLPAVLARKERKSYMKEPVLDTLARSITTQKRHAFYLDADDVAAIAGHNAAIIDDIVSTFGTVRALAALVTAAGGTTSAVMAVGTEGDRRDDVIALHHFPVYAG